MKQRWLVAIVGLPLLLLVLLACPQWATTLLVCAISGVAAYELLHVAGKNIGKAVYAVTILCAVAQVWVIYDVRKWYEVTVPLRGGAPFDKCLILPWVLVMFLFYEAVARYGKGNDLPFTDVATGIVAGAVLPGTADVAVREAGDGVAEGAQGVGVEERGGRLGLGGGRRGDRGEGGDREERRDREGGAADAAGGGHARHNCRRVAGASVHATAVGS